MKTINITADEAAEIISDFIKRDGPSILTIPGVWEVLSEHYNNEMIDEWIKRHPEADDNN